VPSCARMAGREADDDDWQVPTKAALTLTLEELDLDAAASQKRWDSSYSTRGTGVSTAPHTHAAAAFTLSTRNSRAGKASLFDDDPGADRLEDDDVALPSTSANVTSHGARPTAHTETDEPPARAAQLEYEVVDPALLQFERVDFLDDASSGGPLSTHEPSQAPPPPSGQSAGVEGGGGDGQRRKDLSSSSLFAGVEDDAGDDWLRLAKRP